MTLSIFFWRSWLLICEIRPPSTVICQSLICMFVHQQSQSCLCEESSLPLQGGAHWLALCTLGKWAAQAHCTAKTFNFPSDARCFPVFCCLASMSCNDGAWRGAHFCGWHNWTPATLPSPSGSFATLPSPSGSFATLPSPSGSFQSPRTLRARAQANHPTHSQHL